MYAIISDGGRQYKVRQGQELRFDLRDAHAGDQVRFEKVLAISRQGDITLGKPLVDNACVVGEVVGVIRGEKLTVQKLRRRKNSRRKTGHRQLYTNIRIADVLLNGESVVPQDAPATVSSSPEIYGKREKVEPQDTAEDDLDKVSERVESEGAESEG